MSQLSTKIKKRGYLRSDITRTHNKVVTDPDSYTLEECNINIARLTLLQTNISQMNDEILDKMLSVKPEDLDEAANEAEYQGQTDYDNTLLACIEKFKTLQTRLTALNDPNGNVSGPGAQHLPASNRDNLRHNRLKLPQIPLPTYAHKPDENLFKFLDDFSDIIDKYQGVSEYEKFTLLKGQLSGEALHVLGGLPKASQNFQAARDRLIEAFGALVTQQFECIKNLRQLKFSAKTPYEFLGSMCQITESFTELNINTEIMQQYFFWNAMPELLQNQFIAITNSNKPTLDEMTKCMFKAVERYVEITKRNPTKHVDSAQIDSYAVNMDAEQDDMAEVDACAVNMDQMRAKPRFNKKQYCSLCSTSKEKVTTHATYACTVYPTVQDKLNRINSTSACRKCANPHNTKDCRYKFTKMCTHCNGTHFSFICGKSIKSEDLNTSNLNKQGKKIANANVTSNSININASCMWVNEAGLDNSGVDSILPTFTMEVNGTPVRALRDSACQTSFIEQDVADSLGLKVIQDDFELNVHGFNSSKQMTTHLVQIPITGAQEPITAVCIPKIRTNLNLPGLGRIVTAFKQNGYTLADKMLHANSDKISNIGIIVGDNESQILPQTDVPFGSAPESMFAYTKQGVLLSGSIQRMLGNIEYLPHHNASQNIPAGLPRPMHNIIAQASHASIARDSEQDILNEMGNVNETALNNAFKVALGDKSQDNSLYEQVEYEEDFVESEMDVVEEALQSITRDDSGRVFIKLLWDKEHSDRLANNFLLAKAILRANFKKLQKSTNQLTLYDSVIQDQLAKGVIEKVDNLEQFMRNCPNSSFLAHMPVFRENHASTPCRVVFLANLCDRRFNKNAINHNQALKSGVNCNKPISATLAELRMNKYILTFDIVKAYLNIGLYDTDSEKLMFLWYKNVSEQNYEVCAFKCKRLPFGIRPSPALLSIVLYKMLILDATNDEAPLQELKKEIFSSFYVDNSAITANSKEELRWKYDKLAGIFEPYQFYLQQMYTNDSELQSKIDAQSGTETPTKIKMFGTIWDKQKDTISTVPLKLDRMANCKRSILSSINANFDVFGINSPLLNRARIFMHGLQCDSSLGWDTQLNQKQCKEWVNICKQIEKTPPIELPRFVGERDSDYNLIGCSDASTTMYGITLHLEEISTGRVSFLASKNHLVNTQMETKSVPSLEFHAIALGVQVMTTYADELAGSKNYTPIRIRSLKLFTDSACCLGWLRAGGINLDKMTNVAPFIKNRLAKIVKLCKERPVQFHFTNGSCNPADCVTRCLSHAQLVKSSYFRGPPLEKLKQQEQLTDLNVTIPEPTETADSDNVHTLQASMTQCAPMTVDFGRFSTFDKLFNCYKTCLQFINKLKERVNKRHNRPTHVILSKHEIQQATYDVLVKCDQQHHFKDVYACLGSSKNIAKKDIPSIVTKVNVVCENGILRVRSKFDRWADHNKYKYPILLSKKSMLAQLIIKQLHQAKGHAGVYSILNDLRRQYYIPCHFSVVKSVIKPCIVCRRVNSRPIQLNQSSYRDFRMKPDNICYRNCFIDHFGPYFVKIRGEKTKVWVLLITCMWSRNINLKLCLNMTTSEFLKALQQHIYEMGTPSRIMSDLGSSITAGFNVIRGILSERDVEKYLVDNGIQAISLEQIPKGNSELAGLVESAVKLAKRMINGTIGRQVLDVFDFQFTLNQATCMVNKRPIAFRESLRDSDESAVLPPVITPESLRNGHCLATLNLLPNCSVDVDPDWKPCMESESHIRNSFEQLNKNRQKLVNIYQQEFIADLTRQATNIKGRYAKVKHEKLVEGDVVLLIEPHIKAINFPIGKIISTTENSLHEVTNVVIRKSNRETVNRHVKSLILLIKSAELKNGENVATSTLPTNHPNQQIVEDCTTQKKTKKPQKRRAAEQCNKRLAAMADQDSM